MIWTLASELGVAGLVLFVIGAVWVAVRVRSLGSVKGIWLVGLFMLFIASVASILSPVDVVTRLFSGADDSR